MMTARVQPTPSSRVLDQNGVALPVSSEDVLSCHSMAAALEMISHACGRRCFQLVFCRVAPGALVSEVSTTSAPVHTSSLEGISPDHVVPGPAWSNVAPTAITAATNNATMKSDDAHDEDATSVSTRMSLKTSRSTSPLPRSPKPAGPPLRDVAAQRIPYSSWPPRVSASGSSRTSTSDHEVSAPASVAPVVVTALDDAWMARPIAGTIRAQEPQEASPVTARTPSSCRHHDGNADPWCVVVYVLLVGVGSPRTPSISSSSAPPEELTSASDAAPDPLAAYPTMRQLVRLAKVLHTREGELLDSLVEHYAGREVELLEYAMAAANPLWEHPRWHALIECEVDRIRAARQSVCRTPSLSQPAAPSSPALSVEAQCSVGGRTTCPVGSTYADQQATFAVRRLYFEHLAAEKIICPSQVPIVWSPALTDAVLSALEFRCRHSAAATTTESQQRTSFEATDEQQTVHDRAHTPSPCEPLPQSPTDGAISTTAINAAAADASIDMLATITELRLFLRQSAGAEAAFAATTLTDMDTRRQCAVSLLQSHYRRCVRTLRHQWLQSPPIRSDEALYEASVVWLRKSGVDELTLNTSLAVKLLRGAANNEPSLAADAVEHIVVLVYERVWERFKRDQARAHKDESPSTSGIPSGATTPAATFPKDAAFPIVISPRRRERMQSAIKRVREEGSGGLLSWRRHVEEMVRLRQVPVEAVWFVVRTLRKDPNAVASLLLHPRLEVRQALAYLCFSLQSN